MRQTAQDILVEQLTHIKGKSPEDRKPWELKLALDVWRACEVEQYHKELVDLSSVPTKDLEKMLEDEIDKQRSNDS